MISPDEFVTWFLGFSDAIKGRPTKEQWQTFKDKHGEAMAWVAKEKLKGTMDFDPGYAGVDPNYWARLMQPIGPPQIGPPLIGPDTSGWYDPLHPHQTWVSDGTGTHPLDRTKTTC